MPGPTSTQINTAVEGWRDTNIGTGAIAGNTPAYNQVFDSIPALETTLAGLVSGDAEAKASNTLTSTANYADGETVSIGLLLGGTKAYTFKATLDNVDGHVKLGATEAASLLNLHHAVNASGGVAGTDYAAATIAHPDVVATDDGAHVLTVTAKSDGADGNTLATTTTAAHATWAHATLTGGTGLDVDAMESAIDDWRDTLRSFPINADGASEAQLDASIPALKTAVASLYT